MHTLLHAVTRPFRVAGMQFFSPLIPGMLLQRYKRFLADVRLEIGRAHV